MATYYGIYVNGERVVTPISDAEYRAFRAVILSTVQTFHRNYKASESCTVCGSDEIIDYGIRFIE